MESGGLTPLSQRDALLRAIAREQGSRSARRKQSFRTPRAVRKRRAVSKCRRVRKRTLRSPSQKPTAENRCRRYPLLI